MGQALELARDALGRTSPNPAVGAVLVREGEVVGRGRTQQAGSWHAEVMALRDAGEKVRGATLYVTLEPCSHYGRTPPCTRAIIAAGVAEVHVAVLDPNPRVNGAGRRELEEAGIRTVVGERADEAQQVIEAFARHITTGLPYVTVKYAMSLDGKIATSTGDSKWISGEESRRLVHNLRDEIDAIIVGVGTALADDPELTVRHSDKKSPRPSPPLRVVVDSRGRIALGAKLLSGAAPTLIATTAAMSAELRRQIEARGAEVLVLPGGSDGVDLRALMRTLGARGVVSALVEGGSTLLGSFFDHGLVDKVWTFVAPLVIGGRDALSPIAGAGSLSVAHALRLERTAARVVGGDTFITGYIVRGQPCSQE
ncbi:MAG: bifunctional diaminohydroxyphosphoribosylaminopyrimidine deaminase/5-amino-6-(5-phosphoribosylamino)uracil reductase RibD [Chloroflexota bacterium]|nr:MAG: bifunctional diaminohydroxyphosphoribosylaminopyrimidine deaminase/5-amino-6-(5-phosphoribosylamino)uracil reductase RibD [Chloroflexota bacterium]